MIRLNPLEANNNKISKTFNLILEHPVIKPLNRSFIDPIPQITLTLLYPATISDVSIQLMLAGLRSRT
jgi:hypothetical protein